MTLDYTDYAYNPIDVQQPSSEPAQSSYSSTSTSCQTNSCQCCSTNGVVGLGHAQVQQLIDTNACLRESSKEIKEVLIHVASLLKDPTRRAAYSLPTSKATLSPLDLQRNGTNKEDEEANKVFDDGSSRREPLLRHVLDTESVRRMITRDVRAENEDNDLEALSLEEIEEENNLFRQSYKCM